MIRKNWKRLVALCVALWVLMVNFSGIGLFVLYDMLETALFSLGFTAFLYSPADVLDAFRCFIADREDGHDNGRASQIFKTLACSALVFGLAAGVAHMIWLLWEAPYLKILLNRGDSVFTLRNSLENLLSGLLLFILFGGMSAATAYREKARDGGDLK